MQVNEFPDRVLRINGIEYLYFGGTNYLAMATNPEFQELLINNIKKWGTSYGSSRNSNVKLSIYESAEKLLAANLGTEAALTVSSGMLAGKFVTEQLKTTDTLFHFPNTHPALLCASSFPLIENGKLNAKLFDGKLSKITILADAIPSLQVTPIDWSILFQIPKEKKITLVLDESHSIGIVDGESIVSKNNFPNVHRKIMIASLGKAMGLTGGVIAGDAAFIAEIKNLETFIGASGMNPAFVATYVKAQELYQSQKRKLQQNINYINTHFRTSATFTYNKDYPVIYFDSEAVTESLLKNNIIATSFKYPTASGKLSRIVVTSNHTTKDLEKLVNLLNRFS